MNLNSVAACSGFLVSVVCGSLIGCSEEEDDRTRFTVTIENVSNQFELDQSGLIPNDGGDYASSPIGPTESYEISFRARPGMRLSFVSMFVQSNDWFVSAPDEGLPLFDEDEEPLTGDISDELQLFDAGTEEDEPPGEGENQAPRQDEHDQGDADPDETVRVVEDYEAADYVRVTLDFDGASTFTLIMENISDQAEVPTPFAPGVFAVYESGMPFFEEGEPDYGEGLEALAEDGDPETLHQALLDKTGLITPLSPGVWVLHEDGTPLFEEDEPDLDEGLEAIAEDGEPLELWESLEEGDFAGSGVFDIPDGGDEPAPAFPGESYSFSFRAREGTRLSLATMIVQTNDQFLAPQDRGIALFEDGEALSGELELFTWDAGTEVNQPTGFGADQAPRQNEPNQGESEDGRVELQQLDAGEIVRVTIEAD